jgi:hypothetical protein
MGKTEQRLPPCEKEAIRYYLEQILFTVAPARRYLKGLWKICHEFKVAMPASPPEELSTEKLYGKRSSTGKWVQKAFIWGCFIWAGWQWQQDQWPWVPLGIVVLHKQHSTVNEHLGKYGQRGMNKTAFDDAHAMLMHYETETHTVGWVKESASYALVG